MSAWTDQIMAQVRARVEMAAHGLGEAMVDDIKEAISTPVVRGFGGAVIGRSAEGDDPYLETGRLQEDETYDVTVEEKIITLHIINSAPYAKLVHDGHTASGGFGAAGPRPFHDLALTRWEGRIPSDMAQAIAGDLSAV